MNTETTKHKLQKLVDTVNSSSQRNKIKFDVQNRITKHMSVIGGNGRLCIIPTSTGYDIGLSGKSLTTEMYGFMCELTAKDRHDKYGFPAEKRLPKWEVDNFEKVEEAVYHYANTIK